MLLLYYPARALNRTRLVAIKTCRANVLLQLALRNLQVVSTGAILSEQPLRHGIDTLVRALRRKNRCDEQLQRVAVIERAGGVRVFALQKLYDFTRTLFILFPQASPLES